MTRVALLPSSYPPSLGGVEELTRHLALALIDAGDQVEVWTCHPDDAEAETVEIRDGMVVRRLPMPLPATDAASMWRAATTGPRSLFSLRNAADAFRPDVLHVQCFGPNGAYAAALSRITGRPLVLSLQGETMMDDADIFEESRVLRTALRSGIRRAAAVTACSAFTLDDATARFGLEPGRGRVIPNGVALEGTDHGGQRPDSPARFSPVPEDPARPYVLALGRVVEKKGFDLLLAAYAGIETHRRTSDLVIAGSGMALDGLVDMAADLGVADRVHFVGRLSREDVAAAMDGATAFVMPSRLEPFGIVVLEAWRAGVAVVASNRGGAPEFVDDGVTGVLVDPFDTAAFSLVLDRIMDDASFRRSIAAAGHARVPSFDWRVVAQEYRQVYRSVAGPSKGGVVASGSGTSPSLRVGESVR
jgi:glycogen(starch) synthase